MRRLPDPTRRHVEKLWRGTAALLAVLATLPGAARGEEASVEADLRIAFGTPADRGSFLSHVLVQRAETGDRVSVCGGSIVDDRWVLTAAHCVQAAGTAAAPAAVQVIAGTQVLGQGMGSTLDVASVLIHPGYRFAPGSPHDVALLRLATPTNLPRQLLASATARPALERAGELAVVAGFGRTEMQRLSRVLLRADVPLLSEAECRLAWQGAAGVPPDGIGAPTICAGWGQAGRGESCNGDSGGPLMVPDALGSQVQIGIVSWGPRGACGETTRPAVYASVAFHETWIRAHVPGARFAAGPPPMVAAGPPQAPAPARPPAPAPRPSAPSQAPAPAPVAQPPAMPPQVTVPPLPRPEGVRPSALPQLSLDIVQGERLRVGTPVQIRLGSSIEGHLVVFAVNAEGAVTQIAPNRFSGRGAGQARSQLRAGEVTLLPGVADGFQLTAQPPLGRARIVGLVLPDVPGVQEAIGRHLDLQPIPGGLAYIRRLAELARAEVTRSAQVVPVGGLVVPPHVAMADVWFTVVP